MGSVSDRNRALSRLGNASRVKSCFPDTLRVIAGCGKISDRFQSCLSEQECAPCPKRVVHPQCRLSPHVRGGEDAAACVFIPQGQIPALWRPASRQYSQPRSSNNTATASWAIPFPQNQHQVCLDWVCADCESTPLANLILEDFLRFLCVWIERESELRDVSHFPDQCDLTRANQQLRVAGSHDGSLSCECTKAGIDTARANSGQSGPSPPAMAQYTRTKGSAGMCQSRSGFGR